MQKNVNAVVSPELQEKKKVLFLCYHNSARSQMAEGLLRSMYGDSYEVYSAGIEATIVDPRAIKIMEEIGIDISTHRSKATQEFKDTVFDIAITVCDRARQNCPVCSTSLELPDEPAKTVGQPQAKEVIHKSFRDPADAVGSEEEQLEVFRHVRDEIKDWLSLTFA
ncbi:arsenate reductase ArsC [Methanolobus zinderi]|uniref:Arsenate reductase ArsC n=1 Tax=Methanolobus zinderi TaxID=536044 RepID=A0A7D5E6Y3_9EURY|nr:arsenate reductase ArsC [Methanolobus zinderi]QLC49258.1 arsenate reductase ArsC [Methanolobus zinderi]